MSLLGARCDRIREQITIDAVLEALHLPAPGRGRIRCIWPDHEDRSPAMQVYRENNSVYCFACNHGGDVIEVARCCAAPPGVAWTVEQAVDWLDQAFQLPPMSPAHSLQQRLRKRLSRRAASTSTTVQGLSTVPKQTRRQVEELVIAAFREVERGATPGQLAVVAPISDYIWQEAQRPEVDPVTWAAWARSLIYGTYARTMALVAWPEVPRDVVDDRPHVCVHAKLWDLHRGVEYPSAWHLQLV